MTNGAASLVYFAMFLLALIPVGIYCHHVEQRDGNNEQQ